MAGAERIAASAITATASRAQHSPMRNFRPAFEDIMLSGGPLSAERAAVPQKLAAALGSLMESAREKGVEAQVDGILRTYASEIKNDIVLLTISRLRDLVQSLPPERLAPRLGDIPHLMREFPQAADTVPEIVMNAERMHGGSRLGLEPMRKMIRSVVGRSKSLCPKELFSVMRTDYESGKFDSIAGVAEARGAAGERAGLPASKPIEMPQAAAAQGAPCESVWPQEAPQAFAGSAQAASREVPDSAYARPEIVWCDEVKVRKRRGDEQAPVFESFASAIRGEAAEEGAERKKGDSRQAAAPAPAQKARPHVPEARAERNPRSAERAEPAYRSAPAAKAEGTQPGIPSGRRREAQDPPARETGQEMKIRAGKPEASLDGTKRPPGKTEAGARGGIARTPAAAPPHAARLIERIRLIASRGLARVAEKPPRAQRKAGRKPGKQRAEKGPAKPEAKAKGRPAAAREGRDAKAKERPAGKGIRKAEISLSPRPRKTRAEGKKTGRTDRHGEGLKKERPKREGRTRPGPQRARTKVGRPSRQEPKLMVKRAPAGRNDCSLRAESRKAPRGAGRLTRRERASIAMPRQGRKAVAGWRNSF